MIAEKLGIKRSTYAHQEKNGIPTKYLPLYSNIIMEEFGYSVDFLINNELCVSQKSENSFGNAAIISALEIIEQQIKEIKEKIK